MSATVVVLRPRPGADRTAERAAALRLRAVVSPLFEIERIAWAPPDPALFDALLLTSGNAARAAGAQLDLYGSLPCYVVGEATAEAAREGGLRPAHAGTAGVASVARRLVEDGRTKVLHLCGRERMDLAAPLLDVERVPVYSAKAVPDLTTEARRALAGGAVALVHSPRAGARLAELVAEKSSAAVAAISQAAAAAAGEGWAAKGAADVPTDSALLELAAKLCNYGRGSASGSGAADGL